VARTFLLLDGDAGPIADLLVSAGKGIEKSGFTSVGIAD
jgi:hypothetical protein